MERKSKYTTILTEEQATDLRNNGIELKFEEEIIVPDIWIPNDGEEYYFIQPSGNTSVYVWDSSESCMSMLNFGNVFKTEKEAIFEVNRRVTENALMNFTIKDVGNYAGYNYNVNKVNYWTIMHDRNRNELIVTLLEEFKSNRYIFASPEDAQYAINAIGEDLIIKYLFNNYVEDEPIEEQNNSEIENPEE